MEEAVQLNSLSKRFGRNWVLANLDLTVQRGESIALFGPNGCGKSTLLKVIATLLRPTTGTLLVLGYSEKQRGEIRKKVRLVSHEKQLYGELTALENLRFAARLRGFSFTDNDLEGYLQKLEILPAKNKWVREFSEGMKKRLMLAKTLIGNPELILLDEPYPSLDRSGKEVINSLIEGWRQEGKTILIASHDHDETLRHVDRSLTLQGGNFLP
ncbi:MAG: ABC transporter ATP-binding protein [Deltaproteobacteria bacterium]|nr:ABC transporter ATP-binding protein [Deltaproteobacteria bacterium]